MADGFTIGEVLNQLKEDFADITISKIRFLESEGLISPDRTESGYRKFTEDDVDRLRFILTAQRDHYLPLKVIREQLDKLDRGETPSAGVATEPSAAPAAAADDDGSDARSRELTAILQAAIGDADGPRLEAGPGASLGMHELCEAAGLEPHEVRELREFGVLGDRGDDANQFHGEDLVAARAARELLQLGLEPRHLRMFRQFCDRQLSLFEQMSAPMLRQRNPEARRQATGQLEKLAGLTGQLQQALLTRSLRAYLHRP